MQDKYWTLVDHFESTPNNHRTSQGSIYTYERVVPGGKLIMTEHRWQSRLAATIIFVANTAETPHGSFLRPEGHTDDG